MPRRITKRREVALRAHGLRAPPDDQAGLASSSTTAALAGAAQDETVHTTANHPWLTADRGWVLAGDLRSGEQIVRDGSITTKSPVGTLAQVMCRHHG